MNEFAFVNYRPWGLFIHKQQCDAVRYQKQMKFNFFWVCSAFRRNGWERSNGFQTPSRLSMAWVRSSGLVYGLVRSFPAHTRVTEDYLHSWNQMSLSSDKKLRSRHPWVKLAPHRTTTCKLSYPRARSDSLAAAPSSHSCSEALRYIQETQTRYIFAGLT